MPSIVPRFRARGYCDRFYIAGPKTVNISPDTPGAMGGPAPRHSGLDRAALETLRPGSGRFRAESRAAAEPAARRSELAVERQVLSTL
ncbi:MAG: hypothetical protein JSW68_11520 [Burkholderiales bacterium]|nr:MAG: hypothetical protein JSW68_11520 [Burkholderiales bacterium]